VPETASQAFHNLPLDLADALLNRVASRVSTWRFRRRSFRIFSLPEPQPPSGGGLFSFAPDGRLTGEV